MTDFKDIRSNLINLLEDINEQLVNIIENEKNQDETTSGNLETRTVDALTNKKKDTLANTTRVEIENIKQAISQIDNKTYGLCLECGQPLNKEQLMAMPFSKKCINCQNKEDPKKT